MSEIKYINETKKDAIYFFVDDSGTLMSKKQQLQLKEKFKAKQYNLENDLKSFSVTAVCMTRNQIKKGQRLSKSIKASFDIDVTAPFHRNKMKPNRANGAFKNTTNEELFTITQNLNKFIKKNNITFASVGLNNYAKIYNGNEYNKKQMLKEVYTRLIKSINKIMNLKYPNKKAIVVFEGENPSSDYSRYRLSKVASKEDPSNKIRSFRFMKKTNKKNIPNFGIEMVDYINGSMFSMYGLADFNIHFRSNLSVNNLDKLEYFSYIL